jgi:predicted ribosome quality control (RQC) complex YloA/Tae2 family protein
MADSKLDNISDKLDSVVEKMFNMNTKLEVHIEKFESHAEQEERHQEALRRNTEVLQQNTESLKDHMQRTDLLESYVKKIDERFTPIELESLRQRAVTDWWKGKVMFLAKLGGAIGALGAIMGIVKWMANNL